MANLSIPADHTPSVPAHMLTASVNPVPVSATASTKVTSVSSTASTKGSGAHLRKTPVITVPS